MGSGSQMWTDWDHNSGASLVDRLARTERLQRSLGCFPGTHLPNITVHFSLFQNIPFIRILEKRLINSTKEFLITDISDKHKHSRLIISKSTESR